MPNAPKNALDERLRRLERRLWWHPKRREVIRHLHNLMALVDLQRLEAARQHYDARIAQAGAESRYKYFDVAYYGLQKLLLAYRLGLAEGGPRRVLDIGTGAGHFPFVCSYFGHSVVGIDIVNPVYERIAECLAVQRTIAGVQPGERLPPLGGTFDMITACNITFDEIRTPDRRKQRSYWSLAEWQFFFDDLVANQLRYPGRIYLKLNKQWRGRFLGLDRLAFDHRLLMRAARDGMAVSHWRGTIDATFPSQRTVSILPSNASMILSRGRASPG